MITMVIPRGKVHEWLWYETGFEQMHAMPEIIAWMEEQGWSYHDTWGVSKLPLGGEPVFSARGFPIRYQLWFTEQQQLAAFRLRWS